MREHSNKDDTGWELVYYEDQKVGEESPSTTGQGTLGNQRSQGQHPLGTESATENIPPGAQFAFFKRVLF